MAASIFEPVADAVPGEPVGDWHPTRYTPSLTGTEEFTSRGDRLLEFTARYWRAPDVANLVLDQWQRWLIRHVLEVYPPDWPVVHLRGELRYRQVVISMGRQNGKSLLASLFAIFFLVLHVRGPRVISLASVARQAHVVYDRVRYAIDKNGTDKTGPLASSLKTTATRGVTLKDGSGIYQVLPADEDSAQGEPASGVLYDELHLGLASLWDAMLLAMRARRNALMVGITTAGDDASDLLIRLYREGEVAIGGGDERFGFFLWEAPTDELTEAGVIAANPAVACGRIPWDVAWSDAVKMWNSLEKGPDGLTGRQRCIRYTLNRFIQGAADAWTSALAWKSTGQEVLEAEEFEVVYGVCRTLDWSAATITATSYDTATRSHRTYLVAQFVNPSQDVLEEACQRLGRRGGAVFAMDARNLGKMARNLKDDGYEVWSLGDAEMHAAAQHTDAMVTKRRVFHPRDAIVGHQMIRARRRVIGDSWRLSWSNSTGDIDAVVGLVTSAYVSHTRPSAGTQLF